MIENVTTVGEQGGDGLAGVDGAAAAEGDDEVAAFARGQGHAIEDGLNFRLSRSREDDAIHAILAEKFEQRSGAKGIASGDDQGTPPKFGGKRAGFADSAGAEDDAVGSGEFKAHAGDGIRRRTNRRGHLRVGGCRYLFRADGTGLGHSRGSV